MEIIPIEKYMRKMENPLHRELYAALAAEITAEIDKQILEELRAGIINGT